MKEYVDKMVYIQGDIHMGDTAFEKKLKDMSWGRMGVGIDISGVIADQSLQLAELDAKLDKVENDLYLSQQREDELKKKLELALKVEDNIERMIYGLDHVRDWSSNDENLMLSLATECRDLINGIGRQYSSGLNKERILALEECAAATKQALETKSSEDVRKMKRAVEALEVKSPLSRNR